MLQALGSSHRSMTVCTNRRCRSSRCELGWSEVVNEAWFRQGDVRSFIFFSDQLRKLDKAGGLGAADGLAEAHHLRA